MAIRYVCDHWVNPEAWYLLDEPGSDICTHFCSADCLVAYVTHKPVAL